MPSTPGLKPPALPLLLLGTPSGLEQILMQEGVPFRVIEPNTSPATATGRFVLHDGRADAVRRRLTTGQVAIDIGELRDDEPIDPFRALVDTKAHRVGWDLGGVTLRERVTRFPKAEIRRRMIDRLRTKVLRAGGLWARLAPFPSPYRSAFNFRADLDEPCPDDYRRYAVARRPIDDCSTHFISTSAYGDFPEILADLRYLDPQSHGHHHYIYRNRAANSCNLVKANEILRAAEIVPVGFASPEGRWNPGLDAILEESCYEYASDFAVGHDDWPFFPRVDGRTSRVLQVPVHPICEGLFLDAGVTDPSGIAAYFTGVLRAKVAAGEPAFLYGHPERRLGRMPEVVDAIAREVGQLDRVWRVTLTEFARWWRWRAAQRWSLTETQPGRYRVQIRPSDRRYPLTIVIERGADFARWDVEGDETAFDLDSLRFERRPDPFELPTPRPMSSPASLRRFARSALDWETITPVDELPEDTPPAWLKKRLRRFREARAR